MVALGNVLIQDVISTYKGVQIDLHNDWSISKKNNKQSVKKKYAL